MDDIKEVASLLIALLQATSLDAKSHIVERYPELLGDAAQEVIAAALRKHQPSQEEYQIFVWHQRLLQNCRIYGISPAFAEQALSIQNRNLLQQVMMQIAQATGEYRANLCRQALGLAEASDSALRCALLVELGNTLYQSTISDRAQALDEAIVSYETALGICGEAGESSEYAAILASLASVYSDRLHGDRADNLEQAIHRLTAALSGLDPTTVPEQWAVAQLNRARAFKNRIRGNRADNIERAIEGYDAALQVLDPDTMAEHWALAQTNCGLAYAERINGNRADNLERAIGGYLAALEVQSPVRFPQDWAMTLTNLGLAYWAREQGSRADNVEKAIECYSKALQVQSPELTPANWAMTQMNLALAQSDRLKGSRADNLESAISTFLRMISVITKALDPVQWATANRSLGAIYLERIRGERSHNIELAIRCFENALEIQTKEDYPHRWAAIQMNLAIAYSQRVRGDAANNLELAISGFESALEIQTETLLPGDWAKTQMNLASAYMRRIWGNKSDNIEAAIVCLRSSLRVNKRHCASMEWAKIQTNLATAYLDRLKGNRAYNVERAIRCSKIACSVWRRESAFLELGAAECNLALMYSKRISGDRAQNIELALSGFGRALELLTLENDPDRHLTAQLNLGLFLFDEQRWSGASSAFESTMAAHRLLYELAVTDDERRAALSRVRNVPALLAYSLAHLGNSKRLDDAVQVLENGRVRLLTELLAINDASLNQVASSDQAVFGSLRDRIRALQSEARSINAASDASSYLSIANDLREAIEELKKTIKRIRIYNPSFLPETTLEAIRSKSVQCPLVYVMSTSAGGMALLVHGNNTHVLWLPSVSEAEVHAQVVSYFKAYEKQNSNASKWLAGLDDLLNWLWEAIMVTLLPAVSSHAEIVLIPCDILSILPLHAASPKTDESFATKHYAIDQLDLRYAPSATMLRSRNHPVSELNDSILAIGNPASDHRMELPNAQYESDFVASQFDSHTVLQGAAATRQAVLEQLSRHSVLHFSCHGTSDFAQPLRSGLVMAGDETVTLMDFLEAHLPHARVAVLSACSTGLPDTRLPDESFGLPGGLLQAGLESVVSSLWFVPDNSTMILIARFYYLWRKLKIPRRKALSEAQRWLKNPSNKDEIVSFALSQIAAGDPEKLDIEDMIDQSFSHPVHWAAFTYTGV